VVSTCMRGGVVLPSMPSLPAGGFVSVALPAALATTEVVSDGRLRRYRRWSDTRSVFLMISSATSVYSACSAISEPHSESQ
jgi:hypothetical protein